MHVCVSYSYTDLNSAFEGLKAQSQASFELVEEARTTLSDLTEAQKSVAARCEGQFGYIFGCLSFNPHSGRHPNYV
jgi:hypothetical protein